MAVTETTKGYNSVAGAGMIGVTRWYTGSGTKTWYPPKRMIFADIECIGSGAGGGGTDNTAQSLAVGGSGGSYAFLRVNKDDTTSTGHTVTVGAGGAGGANTGADGAAGANSSVGTLCVAVGGVAGTGSTSSAAKAAVAGGDSSGNTGTFVLDGGPSGPATVSVNSGHGGDSPRGFGFGGAGRTTEGAGIDGTGYGSGGGGAASIAGAASAGGDGQNGLVIITEYIPLGG